MGTPRDTGAEQARASDGLDVVATAFWGAIGVVLIVVLILAVQAFYFRYQQQVVERKVVQPPFHELVELRSRQEAQLHAYRMLDAKTGRVAIPIERAMELVLEDWSRDRERRDRGGSGP